MKLGDAISDAVMASLTEVLKPLIEEWNKMITTGPEFLVPGLIRARDDVQLIIDTAKQRVVKRG